MSNRAVLAWLLVAIVAGVAVYFFAFSGSGTGGGAPGVVPVGTKVLNIAPARVVRLTVGTETVSRQPGTDTWSLGTDTGAWPIASSRINAMLAVLADMRATGEADAGAGVGANPTPVTIEEDDGRITTVQLAATTLGGSGLVSVQSRGGAGLPEGDTDAAPRLALVDDNVHRALRTPGPRSWRASGVISGFDPNPPRIRLESSAGVLALRRVEGRWGVTEPMQAPADPSKVSALMKSLGELVISDFLDTPLPANAATGLNPASASITLESDTAAAGGAKKRTIELGGPADASGKRLYARIDGARTVVVDAAGLAGVSLAPGAYIAGTASALTAPDIGSIVMAGSESGAVSRRLVRETDGWTEVLPSGRGSLLAEADRTGVNDALKFLIERPASEVGVTAPKGFTPIGTLELGGLDGRPLETFEVGAAEGPMLTLKSSGVFRSYPLAAAPPVLRSWVEPAAPKLATPLGPDGKPLEPMK